MLVHANWNMQHSAMWLLKCRVGQCNLVVSGTGKHNGLYRNKIKDT
jgi:hypothetical protein